MSAGLVVLVAVCAAFGLVLGAFLSDVVGRLLPAASGGRTPWSRRAVIALVTAGLFALMGARLGMSGSLPAYLTLVGFLVVLSFVDLETRTLPRRVVYTAGAAGVPLLVTAALVAGEPERIVSAAIGAVVALVALWLLHSFARGGFGFGDVRLGAVLGLYLGWQGLSFVPTGILLAFVLSSVTAIGLMAIGKAGRRTKIPFGPFLALGALVVIAGGQGLLHAIW